MKGPKVLVRNAAPPRQLAAASRVVVLAVGAFIDSFSNWFESASIAHLGCF